MDLGQIFNMVIECTKATYRGSDSDAYPYTPGEGVEEAEKSLTSGLVCRSILVDEYVDIVIGQNSANAEEWRINLG